MNLAISESRDEHDFQNIQSSLWLHRKNQRPQLLLSKSGFEYENLTTLKTKEEALFLITWRTPSRGQYLSIDLFRIENKDDSISKISIEDMPDEIYAGQASLALVDKNVVLELRVALHGHFYSSPYIYQIQKFQLRNGLFEPTETKYSRPEDSTQYLNLGKHFLDMKQFKRSVVFYVKGLKLQSESPQFIDDPVIAEIQLNLAKAYVGTGDREKSQKILKLLVNSFPQTTYARRAHKILGNMPK
mgnify:CR=1 FL=1